MGVIVRMRVCVLVSVRTALIINGNIVLMKMKKSQQQQHENQATNDEVHCPID
jgi:hypothetical protein